MFHCNIFLEEIFDRVQLRAVFLMHRSNFQGNRSVMFLNVGRQMRDDNEIKLEYDFSML